MGFRWYGEDNDKISLADIKQIPGVTSIVWALHHKLPGEVWTVEEIAEVQKQLEPYGFNMDVVESVNVHDDIKIGLPSRDQYIENYIQTIKNLSKFGVKVICYNFMPIFDWTRTDLFHPVGDGSTALYYEAGKIHDDPKEMADYILNNLHGMTFPGWEPERMEKLDELFAAYKPVTKEVLWENLKYFLEALMPTCAATFIKLIGLPLIFLPAALALGFRNEALVAIIIMLGSPTTVTCYIMARNMKNDEILSASVVVLATLVSSITLTGWIFLMRSQGWI